MADQFARPSADTSIGTYTDQGGGTTNIYTTIDEATPANNADYIRSVEAPSNAPYVTKLTNVTDPTSSTGHIVRYTYAKSAAAGAQINLTVQLRQGYVNEGSPGTLIASWSHTDISHTFTDAEQTLSGGEADAISDYTSLYLRFVFTQV